MHHSTHSSSACRSVRIALMAGTIGRPPCTGVGGCVRWQGDRVGFFGGLAGICGECLSSAETVSGVFCSVYVGEKQVAEGAASNCRYRNLSARSPCWASCALSWAPGIHCDMDGAGSCRCRRSAKVVARAAAPAKHTTTHDLQHNHHDGTTHRTLRRPYHSCAIAHRQPHDAQKSCLRHNHAHSMSHLSVVLAHSRRLLRALRTMSF
jgi:hypothetical protein